MEPTEGPISVSIKSNNTLPESHSETTLKNKGRKRSMKMKRSSSTPENDPDMKRISVTTSIELEMVISLTSGSEYHKITETFEQRTSGVPTHMDMIKKIKPDLNLAMLQHVPTEKAVHSVLQYHDFK